MYCSTSGLPVHRQLPEPTQTRPLSWWYHPTISSSVILFSSYPQSFPASGSFQMSQLFTSGGQSIGVSASTSVLPMNTQDWSPLGPHHSAILLLDTDDKNNNHENISSYLCLFQHYLQYPRDENKLNVQWQMNKENVMYIHIHITYTLSINSYTCVCIYIYVVKYYSTI